MARFVSAHRNFAMGVRGHKPAPLGPDGKMVPEQTELSADFTPDLRTDEDTTVALAGLNFRGLPIFEDGRPVTPHYRISVFDSEIAKLQNGWTDEDEALVVDALRSGGGVNVMYLEVIPAKADKPWNGYDGLTDPDKVVELALAIDADLTQVAQYERENLNRPEVIAAITAAIEEAGETITVSA